MSRRALLIRLCAGLLSAAFFLVLSTTLFLYFTRVRKVSWFSFRDTWLVHKKYPNTYDPLLGWVPPSDQAELLYPWGPVKTLKEGLRDNGNGLVGDASSAILAVGDSYTFGDDVGDRDSWPSVLERKLKRRVYNAGVFGYGVDQAYLRATHLLPVLRPRTLIYGLIDDDISRAEFVLNAGNPKPHFSLRDGKLVLDNFPVTPPDQRFKGMFAGWLLDNPHATAFLVWAQNPALFSWARFNEKGKEKGADLFCAILKEMDSLASASNVQILVLLQYYLDSNNFENQRAKMEGGLKCAEPQRLSVLDLQPAFLELRETDPKRFKSFFYGHLKPAGNEWVAERIAEALAKISPGVRVGSRY